ncbi:hypothetical protein DEU29_102110 [Idiomarina aquatica]|uniref:Methyltransferase family protein n=1 Tax=Idiomarina aquatica TaxID=1327752 RepID=A0A4V3CQ87_9GAMM|nr:hypothetical protein [Idiomarina aquatica]TDP40210.1 hypothetical protein DEU29_102110 [Idiomarina aquatica]
MNEQADKNNKINTLTVVVGAGESCNCDLSDNNQHYVLVDARSDAIHSLNEQFGNNEQITTRQVCLTPESGRSSFYHYSLPEFSSTLKLGEFTRYLPGLTVTGNEFVSGITLSQLISDLPHAKVLQLNLELPGQELDLLQALKDHDPDSFNIIDKLTITTSEQRLYEQGNTSDELGTWLEQQGYELSQSETKEFSLLEQTWQVDKKQLQISALIAERDEAVAQASDFSNELEQLRNERDEAVAHASSMNERREQTETERDEFLERFSCIQEDLKKVKKERDTFQVLSDDVKDQLVIAQRELEQNSRQFESLKKDNEFTSRNIIKELAKVGYQIELINTLLQNKQPSQKKVAGARKGNEGSPLLYEAQQFWLEGEWYKLVALATKAEGLPPNTEKAQLAAFITSGYAQIGDEGNAQTWSVVATELSSDKQQLAQLLYCNVNNSLARLYALQGDTQKAIQHFQLSVASTNIRKSPDADKIRAVKEVTSLGLIDLAIDITDEMLGSVAFHQRNTQTAIKRMQSEIRAAQKRLELADRTAVVTTTDLARLWQVVDKCFDSPDVQDAIDQQLLKEDWTNEDKFYLCIAIAEKMNSHQDRLQAISWINQARLFLTSTKMDNTEVKYRELTELAARIEQPALVIDLSVESNLLSPSIESDQKEKLKETYRNLRAPNEKIQQHGHDLLIDYLKANPHKKDSRNSKKKPVLIEVGTTRENVPGQGSTLQLAALAHEQSIQFISVDMDPHNSRWAKFNMELMQLPGETVNQKGEDFLAEFPGPIEYVFLDAYDFDHGNHSDLRQQRYQKYLGSNIDEVQCHKMHLDCAKTLAKKLSPEGVVCVDDTWQDEKGYWTAKGTLAVPYLLENGFKVIEARNRAVLLARESTPQSVS